MFGICACNFKLPVCSKKRNPVSVDKLSLIYSTFGTERPLSLTEAVKTLNGQITQRELRLAYANS